MKKQNIAMVIGVILSSFLVTSAQAQDLDFTPTVLMEHEGVQLWSMPFDTGQSELLGTKLVFASIDAAATDVVTFAGMSVNGSLNQLWFDDRRPIETPTISVYNDEAGFIDAYKGLDSYVLIPSEHVGGGAGDAYGGLTETNDLQDGAGIGGIAPLVVDELPPLAGYGAITMGDADAFFVNAMADKDMLEFAQIVVPTSTVNPDSGIGDAQISGQVLGDGFTPMDLAAVDIGFAKTVPEPASGVLVGTIGLAFLMYRRRRNG